MEHNLKKTWILILLVMLSTFTLGQKDGPPTNFNPKKIQQPTVIKPEPISLYGNPKKYTIFDKTYHVRHNPKEFIQTGIATWYGRQFHGRHTSSREIFDMYAISGAHKELPIPCYIQVTNLDNNRKLIVRINDRGPFHTENRILDLSYAAAYKLGYAKNGLARVRIELISPPIEHNKLIVELGVFKQGKTADALAKTLQKKLGYLPKYSVITIGKQTVVKLFLGPFSRKANLNPIKQALKKIHPEYKIKYI